FRRVGARGQAAVRSQPWRLLEHGWRDRPGRLAPVRSVLSDWPRAQTVCRPARHAVARSLPHFCNSIAIDLTAAPMPVNSRADATEVHLRRRADWGFTRRAAVGRAHF